MEKLQSNNKPVYQFYLQFDGNGGINCPEMYTYITDEELQHRFKIPYQEPIRHGYQFLGWSTSPDHNIVEYFNGSTIDCIPGITILYAVWEITDEDCFLLHKKGGKWFKVDTGFSY